MKIFLIIMTMMFTSLSANTIEVETPIYKLNAYKYETPQGRNMRVSRKTKLVIVAFEQETGALVNKYLDSKDPFYLLRNHAIYIADINKMPSMITKMFALPKLQEFKHLIYLSYGKKFAKDMPRKKAKITMLEIEAGKIKTISYVTNEEELKQAIEKK